MTAKEVFVSVLGDHAVKKLWTVNYQPALPFTTQDFSIGAIMPAILYMFRWGHRRGKGMFIEKYGRLQNDKKIAPSIDSISEILSKQQYFSGFSSPTTQAILGDMLLSTCLENKNHQTGRTEQVQRSYPTHYLTSWIDLPIRMPDLRFIPEMLVALLIHQEDGAAIQRSTRRSHFAVGSGFDDNILLNLFGRGMEITGQNITNLTSDRFNESESSVGVDQLLTIRLAQGCGEAPMKARGGETEQIPNQWPLASIATKSFREDFSVFVQAYGPTIPRQTFLQMLESCISLGLTNIYFSTIGMLLEWEKTGELPTTDQQLPWPFFVDCSSGKDRGLRRLAEESMSHFILRLGRLPNILMCMRIIDDEVTSDDLLRRSLPPKQPEATAFINLLGSILLATHPDSKDIHRSLNRMCLRVGDAMAVADIEPELQEILTKEGNPVIRLSEALCNSMGEKAHYIRYLSVVNSSLMIDEPNGLAQKRKITHKNKAGRTSRIDVRSIILTNPMLDLIVHRHLRKAAKGKGAKALTFIDLIQVLKERYGLFVDESPPGMSIPVEMLLHNKRILERRLRDLGVLVGVNDAESMKRLKQRFNALGDGRTYKDNDHAE